MTGRLPEGATDKAWDAFVASADTGSYLQQSGWARVKAVNGWTSVRLVSGALAASSAISAPSAPLIGAQILVRRPRPLPWGFAYAPRGPVSTGWSDEHVAVFSDLLRRRLRRKAGRIAHVRIDPEVELGGPHDQDGSFRRALRTSGWRPGSPIQPESTRVIDLHPSEADLWGDLRKKWRQYVNRARTGGYRIVDADGDRLPEFYEIYRQTAQRAGFLIRTEQAYRDVWNAYRPSGAARLLFAEDPDGQAQAVLFLVRCGPRVVEPYGGMTPTGADSRANYLLKWEAIRSSREQGATSYDLWGLASPGIAHFKTGFGGREIRYIGAWDLVLDPVGRASFEVAQRGRVWVARRRHGLSGRGRSAVAALDDGADG